MADFLKAHSLVVALLLMSGCLGSGAVTQIGGVSGKAESDGKSLPEGTMISFMHTGVDESFMTTVKADGTYEYRPYHGVPVKPGKYKVVVMPPPPKKILVDGLEMKDPKDKETYPQIPQKFRSKSTTPLEVEVGRTSMEYSIDLK